jgi:hypothetical protein
MHFVQVAHVHVIKSVKLGSSDDVTTITTTMGDVEAMMDPEEKSTIIQIFKQHNNQHV